MDVLLIAAILAALGAATLAVRFYLAKEKAEARLAVALEQRAEWERLRGEMTEAAKASVLSAGAEISSKLLADHKREAEAARKDSEAVVQKTTAQYQQQFQHIVEQVAALKASDGKQDTRLATLWRALSTPAGAGQMAEIGLENTLRGLGLEPGRDFIAQYVMAGAEGNRLKPDYVIFLPQGRVMVIDCKASKFLLELAEAESAEARAAALTGVRRTMQEHLKALVSRDYKAAIQAHANSRAAPFSHVFSIMYLPTESALASLREADGEFLRRAEHEGIIVAGPASLYGLLSLASLQLVEAQKAENREQIIALTEELMDALVVALGYVNEMGNSLSAAAAKFGKFGASVNARVLPRMRKLIQHGAKPAKARDIPTQLPMFELRAMEGPVVEAEVTQPIEKQYITAI